MRIIKKLNLENPITVAPTYGEPITYVGMIVRRDVEWDEYVVNTVTDQGEQKKSQTSYHTSDKDDALDTAQMKLNAIVRLGEKA